MGEMNVYNECCMCSLDDLCIEMPTNVTLIYIVRLVVCVCLVK